MMGGPGSGRRPDVPAAERRVTRGVSLRPDAAARLRAICRGRSTSAYIASVMDAHCAAVAAAIDAVEAYSAAEIRAMLDGRSRPPSRPVAAAIDQLRAEVARGNAILDELLADD